MQSNRQLIVGFPRSGKTTFLVALYHLTSEKNENKSKFIIENLVGDNEYIHTLLDMWLKCEELGSTTKTTNVVMKLREIDTGKIVELKFPDIDGETYDLQFEERKWSKEFQEYVDDADGVFLFIHPSKIIEAMTIIQASQLSAIESDNEFETDEESSKHWSIKEASIQSKLVDIIQFITNYRAKRNLLKIAVIISAWDLIEKNPLENSIKPSEWLLKHVPLLSQYLSSNYNSITYKVYGISALGGNLPDDQELLLNNLDTLDRIKINDCGVISKDFTIPLKWILDSD